MSRFNARCRLLAPVALLIAALAAPVPTAAMTIYGATIVYNYCLPSPVAWKGDVWFADARWIPQADQTYGTMKFCATWYKVSDADNTADYYLVGATVTWTTTYKAPSPSSPEDNYGSVRITTSIAGLGGSWEASPDVSVSYAGACGPNVYVSVGALFIGASANLNEFLCEGGVLNLESSSSTHATWSSPNVTKTRKWEVAYFSKVGQGQHPSMSITVKYPCYLPKLVNGFWLYSAYTCSLGKAHVV